MNILSVGVAFPGPLRPQSELLEELTRAWGDRVTDRERSLLERLAKSANVKTKHLSMHPKEYATCRSFTERNKIFTTVGQNLAEKSVADGCAQAGISPRDLDIIFFTTVTGVVVPSLDSKIAGPLGFREDIKRIPMFGLGCVAGAAGLARVHDYLKAYPKQAAVLLSVELCSLTLQLDDLSAECIVASALFGDGSAAVICVGDEHPLASQGKLRTLTSKSRLYPNSEHIMGWDVGSHGFKILLDPGVPKIVETYFAADVKNFLHDSNLLISDISTWISHPGGPKVLKAIESCLELPKDALIYSWRQLETLGNMSSASVLSILRATMESRNVANEKQTDKKQGHALLMAMGPGFCSELVLCQWIH
jgi:alkylresorcinol/alkylpyrone synthase